MDKESCFRNCSVVVVDKWIWIQVDGKSVLYSRTKKNILQIN